VHDQPFGRAFFAEEEEISGTRTKSEGDVETGGCEEVERDAGFGADGGHKAGGLIQRGFVVVLRFGYVVRFLGAVFEAGEMERGEGEDSVEDEGIGDADLGYVDAETGLETRVVGEGVGGGDVVVMEEF
jgi:hypothetical protein